MSLRSEGDNRFIRLKLIENTTSKKVNKKKILLNKDYELKVKDYFINNQSISNSLVTVLLNGSVFIIKYYDNTQVDYRLFYYSKASCKVYGDSVLNNSPVYGSINYKDFSMIENFKITSSNNSILIKDLINSNGTPKTTNIKTVDLKSKKPIF